MNSKKKNNPNTPNLSIKISQSLKDLDITRKKILNFLMANGINEELISRIELSVYEVLINIIEHSESHNRDKDIEISCCVMNNRIGIEISNYGDKFDITKTELPDIETHYKSGKRGGLGLYIIRTLMDRVDYSYKDHINILKLGIMK